MRTVSDVARESREIRHELCRLALPPSAALISHVGNHPAFVSVLIACLDAGIPLVLLDGVSTEVELDAMVRRFGAAGVLVRDDDPAFRAWPRAALPGRLALARSEAGEPHDWGPAPPAVVKMTSGSTGLPKAILSSEQSLFADGKHIGEGMAITGRDVTLAVIPIAHAYGFGNVVLQLLQQGTTMAVRDTFAPRQLMTDLDEHAITIWPGVPFMFDHVRRNEPDALAIRKTRLLVTAGAPIDPHTVHFFKRRFRQKIHSLYGTSETGSIAFDATDDLWDPLTVGRPLPGVTVSFAGSEAAAPGDSRIHVAGESVTDGYAIFPGEPVDPRPLSEFVDGGYLTSDFGRLNPQGQLILSGRISRFVNVAGRKVHPEEIERVIRRLDGVANASVFGVPDDIRGERLVAWVQPRTGTKPSIAAIRAGCAGQLAAYKIPRQFVFTDHAPVDARGKVNRQALERLVRQQAETTPESSV